MLIPEGTRSISAVLSCKALARCLAAISRSPEGVAYCSGRRKCRSGAEMLRDQCAPFSFHMSVTSAACVARHLEDSVSAGPGISGQTCRGEKLKGRELSPSSLDALRDVQR